mmetsp:Transcript_174/g.550  ORF Transcript_174/g.550 Transcript_174/m.550 type:complete len:1162 (+) Transcript_174:163-3648(+)
MGWFSWGASEPRIRRKHGQTSAPAAQDGHWSISPTSERYLTGSTTDALDNAEKNADSTYEVDGDTVPRDWYGLARAPVSIDHTSGNGRSGRQGHDGERRYRVRSDNGRQTNSFRGMLWKTIPAWGRVGPSKLGEDGEQRDRRRTPGSNARDEVQGRHASATARRARMVHSARQGRYTSPSPRRKPRKGRQSSLTRVMTVVGASFFGMFFIGWRQLGQVEFEAVQSRPGSRIADLDVTLAKAQQLGSEGANHGVATRDDTWPVQASALDYGSATEASSAFVEDEPASVEISSSVVARPFLDMPPGAQDHCKDSETFTSRQGIQCHVLAALGLAGKLDALEKLCTSLGEVDVACPISCSKCETVSTLADGVSTGSMSSRGPPAASQADSQDVPQPAEHETRNWEGEPRPGGMASPTEKSVADLRERASPGDMATGLGLDRVKTVYGDRSREVIDSGTKPPSQGSGRSPGVTGEESPVQYPKLTDSQFLRSGPPFPDLPAVTSVPEFLQFVRKSLADIPTGDSFFRFRRMWSRFSVAPPAAKDAGLPATQSVCTDGPHFLVSEDRSFVVADAILSYGTREVLILCPTRELLLERHHDVAGAITQEFVESNPHLSVTAGNLQCLFDPVFGHGSRQGGDGALAVPAEYKAKAVAGKLGGYTDVISCRIPDAEWFPLFNTVTGLVSSLNAGGPSSREELLRGGLRLEMSLSLSLIDHGHNASLHGIRACVQSEILHEIWQGEAAKSSDGAKTATSDTPPEPKPMRSSYTICVPPLAGQGASLREWLEYYFLLGFEHAFVYDFALDDGVAAMVEEYARMGLVTIIPWRASELRGFRLSASSGTDHRAEPEAANERLTTTAFNHCLHKFGRYADYMLFVQPSEYLTFIDDRGSSFLPPLDAVFPVRRSPEGVVSYGFPLESRSLHFGEEGLCSVLLHPMHFDARGSGTMDGQQDHCPFILDRFTERQQEVTPGNYQGGHTTVLVNSRHALLVTPTKASLCTKDSTKSATPKPFAEGGFPGIRINKYFGVGSGLGGSHKALATTGKPRNAFLPQEMDFVTLDPTPGVPSVKKRFRDEAERESFLGSLGYSAHVNFFGRHIVDKGSAAVVPLLAETMLRRVKDMSLPEDPEESLAYWTACYRKMSLSLTGSAGDGIALSNLTLAGDDGATP